MSNNQKVCGNCIHWQEWPKEKQRYDIPLGECENFFGHYFANDEIDIEQWCFKSANQDEEE